MNITAEEKKDLFKKFGGVETNTGNSEAQIAVLSVRISRLTDHLKANRHDFNTQTALLNMVGQRRRLLNYLKNKDIERYRAVISELGLRK